MMKSTADYDDDNVNLPSLSSSSETIIPINNNTINFKPDSTIYTIPGLNGNGGSSVYLYTIFDRETTKIIELQTPKYKIDLGQKSCINILDKSMISKNKKLINIVHATSQGTATLMNFLCLNKNSINYVKCVILEAVMASGNSAIYHTMTNRMKFFRCIPFGYYVLPYLAKLFRFPLYRPAGIQLIKSLDDKNCKLNKDLLVIIIHSTHDRQLSVFDACALYYKLKEMGMKNVYMNIKKGDIHHTNILRNREDVNMLRIILDAHGYMKIDEIKKINMLNEYYNDSSGGGASSSNSSKNHNKFKTISDIVNLWKPVDHKPFKVYYDNLIDSEKNHKYLEWYIIFMILILIIYVIIIIFMPMSPSPETTTMISDSGVIEFI